MAERRVDFLVSRTDTPVADDLALVVIVKPDGSGVAVIATWPTSSVATRSQVPDNAADVQLVAANPARLGLQISNGSTVRLYLAAGTAAASLTNYTAIVQPGGMWEPPAGSRFTAEVRGIWESDPGTGSAAITEYTA
jgi:hypothetical protein